MKSYVRRAVISFSIMCGLILAGCATTPSELQAKPENINAFFDAWTGSWNRAEFSGGAKVKISQGFQSNVALVEFTVFNPSGTLNFKVHAMFNEGELIFEGNQHTPKYTFKLYGKNTLRIFYIVGTSGEYYLTRS